MLISEALHRRAFHLEEMRRLESRIIKSLVTQEDSDPSEDPKELIARLVAESQSLTELTKRIYRTTHVAKCGGITLAEALIRRRSLEDQVVFYEGYLTRAISPRLFEVASPEYHAVFNEIIKKSVEASKNGKPSKKVKKVMERYNSIFQINRIKVRRDEILNQRKALESQILETQMETHLIDTQKA